MAGLHVCEVAKCLPGVVTGVGVYNGTFLILNIKQSTCQVGRHGGSIHRREASHTSHNIIRGYSMLILSEDAG